jgi:hypothetical protein
MERRRNMVRRFAFGHAPLLGASRFGNDFWQTV